MVVVFWGSSHPIKIVVNLYNSFFLIVSQINDNDDDYKNNSDKLERLEVDRRC